MNNRHLPVVDNSIIRPGYQPFQRTIGDLLQGKALESADAAFLRDDLETLRRERTPRNVF